MTKPSLRESIVNESAGKGNGDRPAADDGPEYHWILKRLGDAVQKVADGEDRNQTGHWFVERLWHQGADKQEALDWGIRYQQDVTDMKPAPYTADEITDTIASVFKRDASRREPEGTNRPFGASANPLLAEIEAMFNKSDAPEDYLDVALDDAALRRLPRPDELVPDWVPAKGVLGFWGLPGAGKTYVLGSIAKAVRRGHRWQTVQKSKRVTRKGAVLFYEGEVVTQLVDRQDAIDERWPYVGTESPQLTIGETPDLASAVGVAAVVRTAERWREELRAIGEDLVMIVFDPLPDFFTGDENGDGLLRAVRALCWIAERLECAVVVGHQSNAAGERARGNDVFRQKVFTYVHIERAQHDLIVLVQQKRKFGPEIALSLWMEDQALPVTAYRPKEGTDLVLTYDPDGPIPTYEYEKQKDQRVHDARERRKADRNEVVHSAVRTEIAKAFKAQAVDGVATFASESKLIAKVQTIKPGKDWSASKIHREVGVMIEQKMIEEAKGGANNAKQLTWIGDD